MTSYTFPGRPPPLAVLGFTVLSAPPRPYASLEHRCRHCGAVYEIKPITLGARSGNPGFCPYCGERARRDDG